MHNFYTGHKVTWYSHRCDIVLWFWAGQNQTKLFIPNVLLPSHSLTYGVTDICNILVHLYIYRCVKTRKDWNIILKCALLLIFRLWQTCWRGFEGCADGSAMPVWKSKEVVCHSVISPLLASFMLSRVSHCSFVAWNQKASVYSQLELLTDTTLLNSLNICGWQCLMLVCCYCLCLIGCTLLSLHCFSQGYQDFVP